MRVADDYGESPRSFDLRLDPYDEHVRLTVDRGEDVPESAWAAYDYAVERTLKQWGAESPDAYPGAVRVPRDRDLSDPTDLPWVDPPGRLAAEGDRPDEFVPLVVREQLRLATPGETDYLDADHDLPVHVVETDDGTELYASVDAEPVLAEAGVLPDPDDDRHDAFRAGQDRLIEIAEVVGADDPSPGTDADRLADLRRLREGLLDGDEASAERYAEAVQSAVDEMVGEGWGSVTAELVRERTTAAGEERDGSRGGESPGP